MRGCAHDPRTWAAMTPEQREAARREIRVFRAFLGHLTEEGKRAMMRRGYWRRYMGIDS